jgi:hypothetical protein
MTGASELSGGDSAAWPREGDGEAEEAACDEGEGRELACAGRECLGAKVWNEGRGQSCLSPCASMAAVGGESSNVVCVAVARGTGRAARLLRACSQPAAGVGMERGWR